MRKRRHRGAGLGEAFSFSQELNVREQVELRRKHFRKNRMLPAGEAPVAALPYNDWHGSNNNSIESDHRKKY